VNAQRRARIRGEHGGEGARFPGAGERTRDVGSRARRAQPDGDIVRRHCGRVRRPARLVVFRVFGRPDERRLPAGDVRDDHARRQAERRSELGGVQDREPPRRASAEVVDPAPGLQRHSRGVDHEGEGRQRAADGRRHGRVLVVEPLEHRQRRQHVDVTGLVAAQFGGGVDQPAVGGRVRGYPRDLASLARFAQHSRCPVQPSRPPHPDEVRGGNDTDDRPAPRSVHYPPPEAPPAFRSAPLISRFILNVPD
jgi:hypothetical protein